jgi:transglutaminase-like putative cysteine protease
MLLLDERIRYRYSGPVTNLRQQLRIVPPPAHGAQRRRSWRFGVDGVESWRARTYLDRFGNVAIDVHVPRVDETVEFVLDTEVEGSAHAGETVADRRYHSFTRLTGPDPALRKLASGTDRCDVATICSRVHEAIEYEWGVTGVRTTAAEALAGGRGVCQDYAHIMLATCRLVGLAARYVSGHLTGEGGSHAWVEVMRPHPRRPDVWLVEGWDPTHNRRANCEYMVVATGRDYADVAPMSGTYDGCDATNTLAVSKRLWAA